MKKILTAIALTIALPAVAHAQTAPAPAPKAQSEMKEKCDCCKDMAKIDPEKQGMKADADPHAGHDMSKPSAPAPADAHKNHQN